MCVLHVCESVSVVCVSLASDSSETSKVIIIKFGTVIASDTSMHHVLIILTWTFIQGHTYINYENNQCWIISETVQAIPIKFRCEDSPAKGVDNLFSIP